MTNKTHIYGLVCPLTNQIRYIGKANNLSNRRKEHHQLSRLNRESNNHRKNWILKLLSLDLKASIVLLEEVEIDKWQEREKFWIKKYRQTGFLTNYLEGGNGSTYVPKTISEETKIKISKSVTRYNLSVEGQKKYKKVRKSLQGKKKLAGKNKFCGVFGTGVIKRRFNAQIKVKLKTIFLGSYDLEIDAAVAYDKGAIKLVGKEANLNFPEDRAKYIEELKLTD